MTQQKSEHRRGAQASGNRGPTRGVESLGGAKAVPVEQQMRQLGWLLGTAEEAASAAADGRVARVLSLATTRAAPKPRSREKTVASATMEEVCERLFAAFEHVAANRGAPGPDRQRIEQVRMHLPELLPALRAALLDGSYQPGDIWRVWIPKAGGGQRGLAARGESRSAFDPRRIPPRGVAQRSNIGHILASRALRSGRIVGLGATTDFHHGLLSPGRGHRQAAHTTRPVPGLPGPTG